MATKEIVLVAGSYEGQLVGFSVAASALSRNAEEGAAARPIFAFKAHAGCIRAACSSADLMVTGSTDNTMGVYNLRRRRAHGCLTQEGGGGAVNALAFHGKTHLLSGGDDGDVCIWRTADWECLLRMKGHRQAIESVAVHPSGRLALSVCKEKKLRLWNLLTGRCNYTSALTEASRILLWSPKGDAYVVCAGRTLRIQALVGGREPIELHCDTPPLVAAYAGEKVLASGGADGHIQLWDASTGSKIGSPTRAHVSRLKALVALAAPDSGQLLVSASSDGYVRVWRVLKGKSGATLKALLAVRTSLRLTCLSASLVTHGSGSTIGAQVGKATGKRVLEEEGEEEGEEEEGDSDDDEEEEEEMSDDEMGGEVMGSGVGGGGVLEEMESEEDSEVEGEGEEEEGEEESGEESGEEGGEEEGGEAVEGGEQARPALGGDEEDDGLGGSDASDLDSDQDGDDSDVEDGADDGLGGDSDDLDEESGEEESEEEAPPAPVQRAPKKANSSGAGKSPVGKASAGRPSPAAKQAPAKQAPAKPTPKQTPKAKTPPPSVLKARVGSPAKRAPAKGIPAKGTSKSGKKQHM